ncbi:MAG: Pyridoxal-dependent decarboxylase [candidate division TM6 bacterium GW2011_GWE2_31_21]|nr:MAG: Pyridoxal-dependent decarboxylase [candidate division TM6 bacterium GW2011_GWE2_31_21]
MHEKVLYINLFKILVNENKIIGDFLSSNALQKKVLKKVLDLGIDFINGKTRNNRVIHYKSIKELQQIVSKFDDYNSSYSTEESFELLKEIGKYSISQSDLGYIAFPDSGNALPAMMAEIYSKFLNQNLSGVDRSAPIATFIEIQLIEWLRGLVGYESKRFEDIKSLAEVSGMCTTGGHMSNHIAIMGALNEKFPEIKRIGLTKLGKTPKIILADAISHYSFSSAMHHLGLGQKNILVAKTKDDFTTDFDDVEKLIKKYNKRDEIFMIVAVAGNSRTSSIDNLEKFAEISCKYKIWLHVDACHGGSLLFSKRLKEKYLKGIEKADSISIDPHKGMFVTYPSSYVLFKERDILVHFTRYEEKVRNGSSWDLGYITPFYGSRGFESLKLWFLIKTFGKSYLEEIVEKRERDAKFIAKKISETNKFVLLNDMELYRLAFVFIPRQVKNLLQHENLDESKKKSVKDCIDYFSHRLNQDLYEDGRLILDEFKLSDLANRVGLDLGMEKYCVMSISIGNPLLTEEVLRKNVKYLSNRAKLYEKKYFMEITKIISGKEYIKKKENIHYGPAGWT